MTRLRHRLALSHALTAIVAIVASYAVIRVLAPRLYDRTLGGRDAMGRGRAFRSEVIDAIDQAVLWGALVGIVAGITLGVVAAARIVHPIARLRAATAELAAGRYATRVERSDVAEIDELAADVTTLAGALADTEQRRVRLLGEVAHEMRTPLTVVEGTVEAMIDGVLPTDDDQLASIQAELRRLRRLSHDLSSLSRAEEGRLDLSPAVVDIAATVAAATERLLPQADDAGVTLTVSTEPSVVDADADRIAQVVTNLVGNALRATPPGGRIAVECRPEGSRAVIGVTDTGEGLAADDLERVFERFYRVPGRSSGGSGIGLTIARSIVTAHGGTLTAHSDGLGRGATFLCSLPLAPGTR